MDAVKACSLDPSQFARQFGEAAAERGFRCEPMAEVAGVALAAYTRRTPGVRPRIYVSSGIHGDEPAAAWALLTLLEAGVFDERATWFLCPLLNPTGFLRLTRENEAGVDLNRDYLHPRSAEITGHVHWLQGQPSFDLCVCLHEDWEATGFYLYELSAHSQPTLADTMLAAARPHMLIEPASVIDGRTVTSPGIIRPVEDPMLRETWPEALYLHAHHHAPSYTLETASAQPGTRRIAAHVAAMRAGLHQFFTDWARRPAQRAQPARV